MSDLVKVSATLTALAMWLVTSAFLVCTLIGALIVIDDSWLEIGSKLAQDLRG